MVGQSSLAQDGLRVSQEKQSLHGDSCKNRLETVI